MNAQTKAVVPTRANFNAPQLDLIQRTVARDCNRDEFDHFMAVADALGLDPLRKQICAIVYNKNDAKKRSMVIVTQIDGFRSIASRCGNYRPASASPAYEYDAALKSPGNPLGIVKCETTLWQFKEGDWHPVHGEAYWDEFAPTEEVCDDGWSWEDTGEVWEDSGKPKKKKVAKGEVYAKLVKSGNWERPRHAIGLCAERQALRKGWPEQFSGLYVEEEMVKATIIDAVASEVLAEHQEQKRLDRVGSGDGLLFVFEAGGNLIQVERGQVADRLTYFYERQATTAQEIVDFRTRNEASLKTFWAWAPADALEVKKIAERRLEQLSAKIATAPAADASPFETLKSEGLAIVQIESVADRLAAHAKWLANIKAKEALCSDAEREEIKTLKKTIKGEIEQNVAGAGPGSPATEGAPV